MKKIFFITILSLFLFSNCEDRHKQYFWNEFPKELVLSYFPYEQNERIAFVSENGNTISFLIQKNEIFNEYMSAAKKDIELRGERFMVDVKGYNTNNFLFSSMARIIQRHTLVFDAGIRTPNAEFDSYIRVFEDVDEDYMPLDPNYIFSCLTDTINLHDKNGVDNAKIVRNKGLIFFIDTNGIKWHLKEE